MNPFDPRVAESPLRCDPLFDALDREAEQALVEQGLAPEGVELRRPLGYRLVDRRLKESL